MMFVNFITANEDLMLEFVSIKDARERKLKVLRRIYGPTKETNGTWRIKSNEELNRLTGNKNIINYIKAQRLAWFGHVHRMPVIAWSKEYTSGHPR